MDLVAPKPELMVQTAMVRGGPFVAKTVQHVPEQGGKTGAVQPITTEPSVSSEGGVGVVIHLSKTREKQINILSIKQRQQTKTPNKPRRQQNVNSDSVLDR
jgi:ATP adenylyltransferase/5',5'''-P-1,P-4-tetraphosphate phosphorylase II